MGEEAVGHLLSGFWGRYNNTIFFWTPNLTYVFVAPFLLPQSLLGLDKVATLLEVVVVEVTLVEVVNGKVATLSIAVVKVAILEDGSGKVDPPRRCQR